MIKHFVSVCSLLTLIACGQNQFAHGSNDHSHEADIVSEASSESLVFADNELRVEDGYIHITNSNEEHRIKLLEDYSPNPSQLAPILDAIKVLSLGLTREIEVLEISGTACADPEWAQATAGIHTISIYPRFFENRTPSPIKERYILWHELGHLIARRAFGTPRPNAKYLDAVKSDSRPISDYGQTNVSEDFAEAFRVYLDSDGGTDGEKRKLFPNRFEVLDDIVGPIVGESRVLL